MSHRIYREVRDALKVLKDAELKLLATSMAFVTVLSIVPLIAMAFAVFKAIGGLEPAMEQLRPLLIEYLASGTGEVVAQGIERSVERLEGSALGLSGFIFLAIASTRLLTDVEKAVQRIWRVEKKRSFLRRHLGSGLMLLLGPLIAALLFSVFTSSLLTSFLGVTTDAAVFFLIFLLLCFVFTVVPNTKVQIRWASLAAFVTASTLWIAKFFYVLATTNIVRYNEIYGSLAAIPIFLIWILILWMIFLFGVALSHIFQKRSEV